MTEDIQCWVHLAHIGYIWGNESCKFQIKARVHSFHKGYGCTRLQWGFAMSCVPEIFNISHNIVDINNIVGSRVHFYGVQYVPFFISVLLNWTAGKALPQQHITHFIFHLPGVTSHHLCNWMAKKCFVSWNVINCSSISKVYHIWMFIF